MALEAAGVDNWSGYGDAMDYLEDDEEYEKVMDELSDILVNEDYMN
jgi:hypothetical protein